MSRMTMWTIYDHPSDYPDAYVAREWLIEAGKHSPTPNVFVSRDIETIRDMLRIEMHLTPIARSPGDDPVIVETWI